MALPYKDTLRHLRIPFSFFLMPVYFLALNQSTIDDEGSYLNAALIFIILHLFIYPASNGYNSYMDKDEGSIGGMKNPPKTTILLFYASILFDFTGLALSLYVDMDFFYGIFAYILVSRAYSWKRIRLKKYPIIGFLSVVIFQGAGMFLTIYIGINQADVADVINSGLLYPMIASSFMIGGVYPLTQIYQHEEDKKNGDITISIKLGYTGTFIFSSIMFLIAGLILFLYFSMLEFIIFQVFLFPVAVYFIYWFIKTVKNHSEANFERTMRMNLISSVCMNACFISIFILNRGL